MTDLNISNGIAIEFGNQKRESRKSGAPRKPRADRPKPPSARERVIKAIEKDGGRYIRTAGGEGPCGLLVCGVESAKDGSIKFMYIDKDRQINIVDHGESYKLVREVPAEMNVLNYIYMNQRNELRKYMENFIAENDDFKLITEIGIRPQKPRRDGQKGKWNDKKKDDKKK